MRLLGRRDAAIGSAPGITQAVGPALRLGDSTGPRAVADRRADVQSSILTMPDRQQVAEWWERTSITLTVWAIALFWFGWSFGLLMVVVGDCGPNMATDEACEKDLGYWAAIAQAAFGLPGALVATRLVPPRRDAGPTRSRRAAKVVAWLFCLWLVAFLAAL